MDPQCFDTWTRALSTVPTRRTVLRGLAGAGFGLVSARLTQVAEAKKKKKNRKPKVKRNTFGCVNVGGFCKSADQCCSGICTGKKGKRKCRAHDTGICTAGQHIAQCGGTDVTCTTSQGKPGRCATTTGNAGFCFTVGDCAPCTTDTDCQGVAGGQLGPRAACIQCATCTITGGTACVTPDESKS